MSAPDAGRAPGRTLEIPSTARRTLVRAFLAPSWAVVVLLAVLFAAGLELPAWAQYAPFALSLALFGLPHGAVDHLIPARLGGRVAVARSVLGVTLLYGVLGGLYLALWLAAPAAGFALFIALTWFHWGQGDLYALLALARARHLEAPSLRFLTVFVRGGLPMLVPLLAFPDVYRTVADGAAGVFGGNASGLSWAFGSEFRVAAGLVFAATVLLVLGLGRRSATGSGGRAAWRLDAVETVLLATYFAVVPPIFAVGTYFCLWHAPRHVARLMLLERGSVAALGKGRFGPALGRFARDAAPLTVAALALLVGLYFVLPGSGPAGLGALLSVYLVLISVLTLPHVAVVSFMDLRQGLWKRAGLSATGRGNSYTDVKFFE